MLLFDGPLNEQAVVPVADSGLGKAGPSVGEPNLAAQLERDSGLHHMGDLARLVLLRYELVAKRRALLAARRASK
jgi:hypothetical protein